MSVSTKLIKIENIEVGVRLRELQPLAVEVIAESIVDGGLQQPIMIRPKPKGGYILVFGRHRLEAERKLGSKTIECRITEMNDDQARLAEIDENLYRSNLSKKEIAYHIAERKKVYEKLYPQTKQGGASGKAGGGKKANNDKVSSFAEDTAKKMGVSKRTVERAVAKASGTAAKPKTKKPVAASTGNGTDPDEGADQMRAAHAANESDPETEGASADKPKSNAKSKAKSEFIYACDHWLPLMSKDDQAEALKYARDVIDRASVSADIIADAPIDKSQLN